MELNFCQLPSNYTEQNRRTFDKQLNSSFSIERFIVRGEILNDQIGGLVKEKRSVSMVLSGDKDWSFEVGMPILGTRNFGAEIQER